MLVKSTQEDKKIPYHDKVINGFKKLINAINPDFLSANPILSGSAAISLVYAPNSYYGDLDIYFDSETNYNKALEIIHRMIPVTDKNMHIVGNELTEEEYEEGFVYWITENAVSVNLPEQKIQLIKKEFLPPEEMIYNHDFSNVSLAITRDTIYTTKETIFSWYEKKLAIRNYQLKDNLSLIDELGFYASFVQRIEKYTSRYSLKIHDNLFNKLKQIQKRINDICKVDSPEYELINKNSTYASRILYVKYLYYGTQLNKINLKTFIYEISSKITSLLMNKYSYSFDECNSDIFQENFNNQEIVF